MAVEKIKKELFNWRAAVKSPNFVPISLKLTLLLLFPLVAYFQDFAQVFSLALSDSEAQYVLLVPFVAAYFFYRRRKAFSVSRNNSKAHDLTGISLCLLALLVYVLGSYSFYSLQLHLVSLPIFVAGVILLIFGVDTIRLLIFPVALLTFLSPFPLFFMDAWGGNLMSSDGTLATLILKPFLPIGITYQPVVILSTVTAAGAKIQFSLNAACSGIYSLTAFLFCAVVFGYLASGSIVKKVLYGVLAVVAAYFLNVFRIVFTVILGHFFGIGLAVEFFHAVGGTVLAFIGTLLLLYFGSKVLKLSFIQKKAEVCSSCKDGQSIGLKQICLKCGRILQWSKIKINWKRLAIVLLFLLVCTDLIVQAGAINYNVALQGQESALNFNPGTGELAAFSNATGWYPSFVGRETQAEQTLGLIFVGDYILTKNSSYSSMNAIFEVSDLQSKFHTWEGCLNYQAYPINIQKITYTTIYDQGSNIVNGEVIVADAPTLNQTINIVYWFDSLNLKTNSTVTNYSVKVTLLEYIANSNNQTTQDAKVEATTNQLLSLSRSYEAIWSQYKNANYSFAVDLYRNRDAFEAVVVALLFLSAMALSVQWFTARRKFNSSPELAPENSAKPPPENAGHVAEVAGAGLVVAAAETAPVVVIPPVAVATKLAFVGVPPSLSVGATSGAISVQLQDEAGNPVNADSAVTVSLSPSGKWYLDPSGNVPISSNQVTIDSGQSSSPNFYFKSDVASTVNSPSPTFNLGEGNRSSFYFKNTAAGSFSLGATGGNYASAHATLTVPPKPPQSEPPRAEKTLNHIVITPGDGSIKAGDSQEYFAEAFDQYGGSLGRVTTSFSAPGALVAGNAVSATEVGSYTVTGTYMGKSASATLTVTHAEASKVVITPADSSVTAGETKDFSAIASDEYGNSWDVTSATAWSISSGAEGSWSGNVYSSAKAGSWTVTGTYNNVAYSSGLTVNPAALDHFVFDDVVSQTANSPFVITFRATDSLGNTVTEYSGMPTLTVSAGTINPNSTGVFSGGVLAGMVTVTAVGLGVTITATDGEHSGTSNPFTVNPTLTVSAGVNGEISPSGSLTVDYGGSQIFTVTANPGFHVADVLVNGASLLSSLVDGKFSVSDVTENLTVYVSFAVNLCSVTVNVGANGSSNLASKKVEWNSTLNFVFTPDAGYHISDVTVKGASVGADSSLSLNVTEDTSVNVIFAVDTFAIAVTQVANCLITGPSSVDYGADGAFTVVPSAGFHIVDVLVDGASVGADSSYMISNVKESHSISAVVAIDTFVISASAGAKGSISPSGSVSLNYGGEQVFTFTPDDHYHVADVLVDGVSVGAVSSYAFTDVVAAHSINVLFEIDSYTISAFAGVGGSISPSGLTNIKYGDNQTFTITPYVHYHVVDVLVDGSSVGEVTTYTFNNVTADHTIHVTFAIETFDIIASAGVGGFISPNGLVSVDYGSSQSFTITANEGYHIVALIVDNVSQGAVSSKTSVQADFTNVTAGHMITAIFAVDTFKITASAGPGGSISPGRSVNVNYGSSQSFNIKANAGYHIVDVIVDGISQGTVSPGTTNLQADFTNVHAAHTITAVFAVNTSTAR